MLSAEIQQSCHKAKVWPYCYARFKIITIYFFFSLMYSNEGPLLRSSRNSETEECEESQCDLVTSAHTAYKVFSMARDMANMFTENNIV